MFGHDHAALSQPSTRLGQPWTRTGLADSKPGDVVALGLLCASRAWRNVLVATYPDTRVSWLPLYAACVAGAGVNALFPARVGDVVRLTMAHRAITGSTYTTLVSSSLVLAIVDAFCVIALFSWAVTQGVLPSLDVLPYLPSFDFAWFHRHRTAADVTLVVLVFGVIVLGVWIRANVAEFRQRVRQAFTVVRTPARWLHRRRLAARRVGASPR